jgi:hypothetical protein
MTAPVFLDGQGVSDPVFRLLFVKYLSLSVDYGQTPVVQHVPAQPLSGNDGGPSSRMGTQFFSRIPEFRTLFEIQPVTARTDQDQIVFSSSIDGVTLTGGDASSFLAIRFENASGAIVTLFGPIQNESCAACLRNIDESGSFGPRFALAYTQWRALDAVSTQIYICPVSLGQSLASIQLALIEILNTIAHGFLPITRFSTGLFHYIYIYIYILVHSFLRYRPLFYVSDVQGSRNQNKELTYLGNLVDVSSLQTLYELRQDPVLRNISSTILVSGLVLDTLVGRGPMDVQESQLPRACISKLHGSLRSVLSSRVLRFISRAAVNEFGHFAGIRNECAPIGMDAYVTGSPGIQYKVSPMELALPVCSRGCGPGGCSGGCCPSYMDSKQGKDVVTGWNGPISAVFSQEEVECSVNMIWSSVLSGSTLPSASSHVELCKPDFATQTGLRTSGSTAIAFALNNASVRLRSTADDHRRQVAVVARLLFKLVRSLQCELCELPHTSRMSTVLGDPSGFNSMTEYLLKAVLSFVVVSETRKIKLRKGSVSVEATGSSTLSSKSCPLWLQTPSRRALHASRVFSAVLHAVGVYATGCGSASVSEVWAEIRRGVLEMHEFNEKIKNEVHDLLDVTPLLVDDEDPSHDALKDVIKARNSRLYMLNDEFSIKLKAIMKRCRSGLGHHWMNFSRMSKDLMFISTLLEISPGVAMMEGASYIVTSIDRSDVLSTPTTRTVTVVSLAELGKALFTHGVDKTHSNTESLISASER